MTTKLLAVDDSKTMRKVLDITFAGDNYDSNIVGSADEALASLRSNPPQVAVVDGHLGGSSGYDLVKQIKAEAPGVKVMLLSSKQRPYDAAQGGAAGVDDHFDKPFDSNKFLDKLGQLGVGAAAPAAAPSPAPAAAVAPRPAPAAAPSSPAPSAPAPSAPAPVAKAPVSAAPVARAPVASKPAAPQAPPAARPQAPPARVSEPAPVATAPAAAAPAAAVAAATGSMSGKLSDMGLSAEQVEGVLALSREVVEQVVWEVVPTLAETLIKEEIARLTAE